MGKFDSKSDEGIFLGYSKNSRAYCVYNSRTHVVIESINVVIDDGFSEGESVGHRDGLGELSVDSVEVTEPKEQSTSDSLRSPKDLDTSNKKQSPSNKPKPHREPSSRVKSNHSKENIIGDLDEGMRLRKRILNYLTYTSYVSQIEPKKVEEALRDECWINAMHEELN